MALVDIKLGRETTDYIEPIVVGEEGPGMKPGDVRWAHWNQTGSPPQIQVDFEVIDKRRTRATRINMSPEYERRGWKLLRDLFAEDVKEQKLNPSDWDDYERFMKAQVRNPSGMKGEKFPEDRLPSGLKAMRSAGSQSVEKAQAFRFSDGRTLADLKKPAPKKATAKKSGDDVPPSK